MTEAEATRRAKDWNPALYSRFEDERTRPARDLLARCQLPEPTGRPRIADLGCGPGNSSELLAARFPEAELLGIDTSEAMVEAARKRLPAIQFEVGDIAGWQPEAPLDLIFCNASLHWLGHHETLLPRLLSTLAPGGVLAVQMPDNLAEPSHMAMREIADEPLFRDALKAADPGSARSLIASPGEYYDWLAPLADEVDIWRTVYQHPMESAAAIGDWFSSTGLRPFLDPLDAAGREAFRARYVEVMEEAYPERADGRRLLAFPRLFIVARRKGAQA